MRAPRARISRSKVVNDLYGDESCGSAVVAYAFVLFPEQHTEAANSMLADVKQQFGATAETELHCSRIFGPTARSKSEWAHLENSDVYDLYTRLFQQLNQLPVRKMAAYARKVDWPSEIKGGPWKHKDPNFVGPQRWSEGFGMSDKHIAGLCGKMALTEIAGQTDLKRVRLWADPDRTPISIGGQHRQASGSVLI